MNDEPRQKLRELIVEYGRSLCDEPNRCEALLKDYCGIYKREIFVLVSALRKKVPDDLLKSSAGVPQEIVIGRLCKQLEVELAMTAEAARWAVESWTLALGFITVPSPTVKLASQSKSATVASSGTPVLSPPHGTEVLIAERYRDNQDGTVTDATTNLQWMRFSLGQEWKNGACIGDAKYYVGTDVLGAADVLNRQGGYAGHYDWRLPTRENLLSLLYCSSGRPKSWNDTGSACEGDFESPTISQLAFPNTPTKRYWSSSIQGFAWLVSFKDGQPTHNGNLRNSYAGPSNRLYDDVIRLVRGEQHVIKAQKTALDISPPRNAEGLMAGRYRESGDGIVMDVTTGLQWMRFSLGQEWKGGTCIGEAQLCKWKDALEAARILNRGSGYAGHREWRIPTKEELQSLVFSSSGLPKTWNDTGKACEGDFERPTIDQQAFPNTPSSCFWSGPPDPYSSNEYAWIFDFGYGSSGGGSYRGRYGNCAVRFVFNSRDQDSDLPF